MNAADSLLSVARKYMIYYYKRIIYKCIAAYDNNNKCIFIFLSILNIINLNGPYQFNSYNIITTNNMR